MKKILFFLILSFSFCNFILGQTATWSSPGCGPANPTVNMILIDACGAEGETEFVFFTTGTSSYNVSNLNMVGSSVGTIAGAFAGNASIAATLNGFTGGCTPAVFVAAPAVIPPNSKVIAFPSSVGLGSLPPPNLAAYCGTGPIYVVSGNYGGGTSGFFVNGAAGCTSNCIRTLTIDFGGGCVLTVTYDRTTFPTGDGVNIKTGGAIFNPGDCFPPPPLPCTPPMVQDYACSGWNVNAYEDGANFNFSTFKGYYNTPDDPATGISPPAPTVIGAGSFGFSTLNDGFNVQASPSTATGYVGCPIGVDGFSISAKKTCFPCAYYKVFLKIFDDAFKMTIDQDGNGTIDYTVLQPGACGAGVACNQIVWEGFLNNNSKVAVQAYDFIPNGLDFKLEVYFLAQPLTLTASNNGPKCPNLPVNLTSTLTPMGLNPTPPYTYSWTGPGGFTASTQNTTIPATVTAGSYNVSITTPTGCSAVTATTPVTITSVNFVAPPDISACAGATLPSTLAVTGAPPPSAGATYLWSGPGLTCTTCANPNVLSPAVPLPSLSQVNNYSVTVTETSGCTWVGTFKITALKPPTKPILATPITVCAGQPLNLTTTQIETGAPFPFPPTATTIPVPVTFLWTGPGGFTSTTTYVGNLPYTVTVPAASVPSTPGTYTYNLQLSLVGFAGCTSSTETVTVTVQASTMATTTNGQLCPNSTLALNTLITTAPVPAGSWSGIGVTGGTTFNSTGLSPGAYTVTFTPSAGGCATPSTATVTVNADPNVNTNQSGFICAGPPTSGTITLTADPGFSSYTWSSGVSGSGNSVTVTNTGIYTLTITNSNSCTTVKTFNVASSPSPTPIITAPTTLCTGATATLSLPTSYSSYLWDNNGAVGATTSTLSVSGPGTYKVTVTNAQGCTGTDSKTITASAGLNPAYSGNPFICGNPGSTTITINNGQPTWTYQWTGVSSTTNVANITTTGSYTVSVTDGTGCTGALTITVSQFPVSTVNITGTTQVCPSKTTTLTANSATAISYKWTNGSVNSSIGSVPVGGPYFVTITDNNGCTAVDSKTVTPFVVATPTIANNPTVCLGATTPLTVNGGVFSTYTWNPSTVIGANPSVGAGTYQLTVTDANSCTATTSATITTDVVNVSITGTKTICPGKTTTLSSSAVFNQYSWSSASNTPTVNVGVGTYTLTVTNANNCTASATTNVTAFTAPTVAILGGPEYCQGSTLSLTTSPTFNNYSWFDGTSTTATTASFPATGTGTYKVTVTDGNSCTATASKNITQNPTPKPVIAGSATICTGGSTVLDAGTGFSNYNWSGGGGSNQTATFSIPNTYTVTVTDTKGCTGTDSKTLTSGGSLTINITGKDNFCPGLQTTLNAGAGFTTYAWTGGKTTQSIDVNTPGTYTVTVSQGACSGTASIVVKQNVPSTFKIIGDTSICQGATGTLKVDKVFSAYSWNPTGLNQSITYTTAGTYKVTVTDTNGCLVPGEITPTINALPTPSITGNLKICVGDSTKLSTDKPYSSYTWSNSKTTPSIFATQFATYSVTVTDVKGCKNSASTNISQLPNILPQLTGKKAFCEGDSVKLSAATGFNYAWSNGGKTSDIFIKQSGTYVVTVSSGACKGVDSIKVVKNLKPILKMNKDTAICDGSDVVLAANAGAAVYQWSTKESTPSISAKTQGIYTVTVTNLDGCSTIGSVNLTVNAVPKPLIIGPTTICIGELATLKLSEKYSSYLWSNTKTKDTIQVNDTNLYSVTVTNTAGCTASTSKSVQIKNTLSPSVIGKPTFCDGASITLGLDAVYATYKWDNNGGTKDSLKISQSGTYTVSVTSASGCKGVASLTVSKIDNPTPVIVGSAIICAGKPSTLSVGSFAKYNWSGNLNTPSITVSKAGTYDVTVTNAEGCIGKTSINVTENQVTGNYSDTLCAKDFILINGKKYDSNNPTGQEIIKVSGGCDSTLNIKLYFRNAISVDLEGIAAICTGQKTDLTVKTSGFTGIFDLTYKDDTGKFFTEKNIQNGDKISINPTKTSAYTITKVSIANGKCEVQLGSIKINVNTPKVALTASNYNGLGVSCFGSEDGSVAATTTQGTAPFTYKWSTNTNGSNIDRLKAGKYKVTVTDAVGCVAVDSVTLKEASKIAALFKAQNPLCASTPKGSILVSDIVGGSGTFNYSLDGTKFSPIGIKPFTINGIETGAYTFTIKDNNGCTTNEKISIEKGKEIKVSLGEDITLQYGDSVVITPTADFKMKSIKWTNSKYLSCDTCQFPIAKPKVTTGFKVTVFSENGCVVSDDILIIILNPRNVFVPNAFSPGTDGTNDYIKPFLGENVVKVNFFRIYDRWGDVVFEDLNFTRAQSQEATRGWNGTFRGVEMNPAVFTYGMEVEFLDGEKRIFKGDVTLVRK